eukprot:767157-Hanusia_phi.AAC.10
MVAEKVVQGSSFKPKGVIQGSVIPGGILRCCDVDDVGCGFLCQLMVNECGRILFGSYCYRGIKAAMDNVNNDIRFKYPLIITEVVYASEAHKQAFIQLFHMFSIKTCS